MCARVAVVFTVEQNERELRGRGKETRSFLTSQLFRCPHTHSHVLDTIKTIKMLPEQCCNLGEPTSDEGLAARTRKPEAECGNAAPNELFFYIHFSI